jgi:PAS domain S-box-containing protein
MAPLKKPLALILFILPLAVIICLMGFALGEVEKTLKKDLAIRLKTNLAAVEKAFSIWAREEKGRVRLWANEEETRQTIMGLVDLASKGTLDTEMLLKSDYSRILREHFRPVMEEIRYFGFFVIDRNGVNIGADQDAIVGQKSPLPDLEMLKRSLAGETVLSTAFVWPVPFHDGKGTLREDRLVMLMSSPVRNSDGEIAAVLSFGIDPKLEFLPIFETVRYGESGETYAFLSNGEMITESRFDPRLKALGLIKKQSILEMTVRDPGGNLLEGFQPSVPREKQLLTRMAQSAVKGERGFDVDGYPDYRGVPVVGAWTWLQEYGFGVASEIDVAEAHSTIFTLTRLFQGLCALIILLAAALFIVRSLMKRVKDITERKRLGDELLKLSSAVEQSPVITFVTNTEGVIEYVNPKFTQVTGYAPEEVIGKNPRMLKSGKTSLETYRELWDTVTSGKEWRGELLNKKKNGELYWESASISPLRDHAGAITHYLGVKEDITERKRTEEALCQAKEAAENATSLKDQFVGLVAHDLKSPFVSILGFLKLIYQDHANPLNPKHKEMIQRSLESGERLVKMVDELLKQCRFRAGKMALQYGFFDSHWIAASVLSDMARQAQDKGIHLRNEIPKGTRLYADPHLFKEVLVNLVSNSIKFCDAGDGITVFVPFGTDSAIAVKDTGLGIKADSLSKLFQPDMFTTTRGTKGEKGMGLGLVFCQEMIKAHGGKITAESVLGQGSTFYISLPVVKPKVLVVDDDYMARQIIREFMLDANVEVGEAENGKMAMEMLKKFLPHLVVTDLCMPEIDGYKLIRHIRQNQKSSSVPIIAITSDRELATREQVFRAGANDFVTKPLMMDEFNPRVKRYVGYGIAA